MSAPLDAELTTVEAADLLNVSERFLIEQLECGALPSRMVATNRRIRLGDLRTYRDHLHRRTGEALDALTAEAEELGLYADKSRDNLAS